MKLPDGDLTWLIVITGRNTSLLNNTSLLIQYSNGFFVTGTSPTVFN